MKASVIVPTRDRPEQLARCVAAIEALDYPDFEVVVVEDDEGRGPAATRNAGAALATGELLAFTDDDCEPEPQWLARLAAKVGERAIAGGRTVSALTDNAYSAASQAINDAVYEHYNSDPAQAGFIASNNLAMPAAAFAELGGFDERFALAAGEDRDLCTRWLELGGTIVYEPEAVVRHSHQLSAAGFWRQHYGYGRGTYIQRKLRAERGEGFELAPSVSSGILSSAARQALAERKPSRLALLGLWQLSNASGFARQALSGPRRRAR